jgi:hypothetical protein
MSAIDFFPLNHVELPTAMPDAIVLSATLSSFLSAPGTMNLFFFIMRQKVTKHVVVDMLVLGF